LKVVTVGLVRSRPLSASATLPHPPDRIFEFLSDLRNHWRLEERFVELDDVTDHGGRVRIRGPLGFSRLARTEVLETEPPEPVGRLHGRAEIGRGTRGEVFWEIAPADSGSTVTLTAVTERLGLLDALLLAAGGRRWMCRLFSAALERLDAVLREPSRD
jgi:uncharacterized protein YndB with AHSA1/START domain